MTLSRPFFQTAAGSDSCASARALQAGTCAAVADSGESGDSVCSIVADFAMGRDHADPAPACNAGACLQSGGDLYMFADGDTQGFILYEDGLIDRPLLSGRNLIRRQPSSAPDTVRPAMMLLVQRSEPLDDSELHELVYSLADEETQADPSVTCAGLMDPVLLSRLTDSLHWHDTLRTKEPDAAQEVAMLEQQVRQNTFEKQSLDTEKQILQNQLNELDRQEKEIGQKREAVFRQIEQLSSRYSQLVTQEKDVETRLRERTLTLIREQMAMHHSLHRK